MKKLLLILCLAVATPLAVTSCNIAPTERTQAVMTLKVLGISRDTAMQTAGMLWRDGKIDDAKRDQIIAAHDKFQEAYRLAVKNVQADLTLASPALLTLFSDLTALIPSNL